MNSKPIQRMHELVRPPTIVAACTRANHIIPWPPTSSSYTGVYLVWGLSHQPDVKGGWPSRHHRDSQATAGDVEEKAGSG